MGAHTFTTGSRVKRRGFAPRNLEKTNRQFAISFSFLRLRGLASTHYVCTGYTRHYHFTYQHSTRKTQKHYHITVCILYLQFIAWIPSALVICTVWDSLPHAAHSTPSSGFEMEALLRIVIVRFRSGIGNKVYKKIQ